MNSSTRASANLMFRWALGIFLVTIVIGILNGLDVWSPSHELLLTHVHAGTLGWITMSVIGVALLVFGGGDGDGAAGSARRVALAVIGATGLYVIAFATTTGIFRPIGGTLMLIAIVWANVWVWGRWGKVPKTVPGFALMMAMISLVIGAILGVLLGLFLANGELPGLSVETAGSLAGAHPPAMLVGYLILAGTAVAEWLLTKTATPLKESKPGMLGALLLFTAGVLFNIAFIADIDALIQAATMLEVIGVIIFIVRMWKYLAPSAWTAEGGGAYARLSVVFLAVGVGLLVYIVQLFVSGTIDPESGEGGNILVAFDHALFIGVMTNALFAVMAGSVTYDLRQRLIVWGTNAGLVVFLAGLLAESSALKRISTPVMGAALLLAVWVFMQADRTERAAV